MTRSLPPLAATGALLAAMLCASPAAAEVEGAVGRAVVLNPLSLASTTDLDFGTLIAGTTAGTATINPASGTRTTSGGTVPAGGAPTSATFVATGVVNRLYLLALGSAPVLDNGAGGTMPVSVLIIDGPALRLFGSSGTATIRVGGILDVAPDQPDGDYAGTFDLTVIYL